MYARYVRRPLRGRLTAHDTPVCMLASSHISVRWQGASSTGLKPFSCGFPGCKSAFGDPSSCARHRKEMHYPRQPFKCFVEGCVSSILRSSAFKAHLRKHGLDPETYGDVFKRNCPPVVACGSVQVEGIMEERITGLQGFSCSSPMLLAPSPRIAQGSDAGYFLTPARALSATSSQYSSPLLMTPALTPTTGMEIMSDVGIHLSPCFMTRDWAPSAWQDHVDKINKRVLGWRALFSIGMLALPLYPASIGPHQSPESVPQYRPAKDIESFNKLLPPVVEFVEGSSSGTLLIAEGKYEPVNGSPKAVARSEVQGPVQAVHQASLPPIRTSPAVFIATPPLLHVLLAHNRTQPCRVKGGFCMSCSLQAVMEEAHGRRRHAFTPHQIASRLQLIAGHMRRGRQEDSHEFLRYAVDALQNPVLRGIQCRKADPKLAETTWVHRIFGGKLRSRVTCDECHHNSDTFDSILDLSVDIHGVDTLRDALRKFTAIDYLKGADKYKCEKCKRRVVASKRLTVHEAPLALTIHLKRFSPLGRKIGHAVRYDERLSLSHAMSEGQYGPSYSLYGVISHAGGGPNSGHYYAHVKGSNDQCMKNAYILFYMRERGHGLQVAITSESQWQPATPSGMKGKLKRKASDADADEKQKQPFIGPLLTSPVISKSMHPVTSVRDPQADLLKKKIDAASKPALRKPSSALQSLSQYVDEDEAEDTGEKVEEPESAPKAALPTPHIDMSSTLSSLSSIPPTQFYGSPSSTQGIKRKLSDHDDGPSHRSSARRFNTPGSAAKHRAFGYPSPFKRTSSVKDAMQGRHGKKKKPII
ncbi:hypothetical protein B0F90DRAFT_1665355 [Multifurca ochricompacta]|uniref:ubiquitinyl hydrolase 1 n=1 Tax=Multifurca ochricompacta TaxID=376703 RepID=A0AAD4MBD7_9AGAM|nr:hypothetical protein B0F90DRAFT_1665355 [Multifurca ochricompacta]